MTQEIIEGNRLITEFMEVKPVQNPFYPNEYCYNDSPFFYLSGVSKEVVMNGIVEYVKYHCSWDWLMPVVEKIESFGYWTKIMHHTSFDDRYQSCDIKKQIPKSGGDYSYDYEGDWVKSKIEAVWLAVIEFIKWYNKQEVK